MLGWVSVAWQPLSFNPIRDAEVKGRPSWEMDYRQPSKLFQVFLENNDSCVFSVRSERCDLGHGEAVTIVVGGARDID